MNSKMYGIWDSQEEEFICADNIWVWSNETKPKRDFNKSCRNPYPSSSNYGPPFGQQTRYVIKEVGIHGIS